MSKQLFRRFEQRYIYPVLALLVLSFIALTWFSVHQWSQVLDDEMLRKGSQMVRNISHRSLGSMLLGDKESMSELLRQTRQDDPDIVAMAIYDSRGDVAASFGPSQAMPERLAPGQDAVYASGTDRLLPGPIADKSSNRIGTAVLRLSSRRIREMIRRTTIAVILVAVAVWIVVGTLFIWLMKVVKTLSEKESSLAGITSNMPDAILLADIDMRIQFWNKAAEKLFGWTAEETVGRVVFEVLVPPEDIAAARELAARSMSEGAARSEGRRRSKGGEIIPVDITAFATRDDQGRFLGRAVIFRDLREVQALRSSLVQSEKMAAVGQLAGGVAHEINNPLGVILGFAQSAVRRIKQDDALSLPLRSIEREAIRCKNLVQNLLVFSRTSSSEQREEFDINPAIEESISLVMAQCKVKGVEVRKELGDRLPRISANKNQVQQIIVNLGNNALDAMPEGGTLTVRTSLVMNNNRRCIAVQMADTGAGIPESIQSKIFNPFFTTKEVGKGTGLGLSLVYEIVQKHAGFIDVKSAVGKGSSFTVSLPATAEEAPGGAQARDGI